MDPDTKRVQPHAKALTDAGQRSSSGLRLTSSAIAGRDTVKMPPIMLFINVTHATMLMMTVVCHFERLEVVPEVRLWADSETSAGTWTEALRCISVFACDGEGYDTDSNSISCDPSVDTPCLV